MTTSEVAHLRELCAKHKIDTTTRKQREAREREQRVPKDKSDKKSTTPSTAQPVTDDTACLFFHMPSRMRSRHHRVPVYPVRKCSPTEAQHLWHRASGYFTTREFV